MCEITVFVLEKDLETYRVAVIVHWFCGDGLNKGN